MAEKIKYMITVLDKNSNPMNISDYFMGGEVTEALDSPSTARFEFVDKNSIIENALQYTGTFPIEFRAKTGSIQYYTRIFIGEVENVDITIDPDGTKKTSFNAYGAPSIRYGYLSPNQIMIGDCDFGQIFTGSPTINFVKGGITWSETWSADSMGNYPNGLLYDTGFTFSSLSVRDFFTSTVDVPIQMKLGVNRKLDYLKEIIEPYDLHFYLDEGCFTGDTVSDKRFRLLTSPEGPEWEFADWFTFSIGKNVNTLNKRISLADYSDKIIAVSDGDSSVFAIEGDGKHELFFSMNAEDNQTARDIALKQYAMNNIIPKSLNITTLPCPNKKPGVADFEESYMIGKRIIIENTDSSLETASVYQINQKFEVDRWTTNFVLSRERPNEYKVIGEITEELERIDKEGLTGKAYIKTNVPTGSEYSYGLKTYGDINGDYYPCAIGLGTSGDSSSHWNGIGGRVLTPDSYFGGPIAIRPLLSTPIVDNITSTDVNLTTTSVWANFAGQDGVGLVREIVLFANNQPGGIPYRVLQTYSFNTSAIFEYGMTNSNEVTMSQMVRGFWPLGLKKVRIQSPVTNSNVYAWKAKDASTAKEIWWKDVEESPLAEDWMRTASPSLGANLLNASVWTQDIDSNEGTYLLRSSASNIPQILLEFTVPVPFAKNFVSGIMTNISVMSRIYSDSIGWLNCSTSLKIWNNNLNIWQPCGPGDAGTFSQEDSTERLRHLNNIWDIDSMSDVIDGDDIIRFLIATVPHPTYPDKSTYSLELNYFDLLYSWRTRYSDTDMNTGTENPTVCELVPFDAVRESFHLSFTPVEILGIWLDGSYTGTEETGFTFQPSGTNFISRFNARDLKLGGAEVFTAYEQDYALLAEDVRVVQGAQGVTAEVREINEHFYNGWFSVFTPEERYRLFSQSNAYFSYSTKRIVTKENDYIDACRIVTDAAYGGSRSDLIVKLNGAPPLGSTMIIEYDAVGPEMSPSAHSEYLDYRGVIAGRALMATDSSVREGMNKNENVTFNIQAVLDGAYYPSVATPVIQSTASGMGMCILAGDQRRRAMEHKIAWLEMLGNTG